MIRDPSDGSVREVVDNDHGAKRAVTTGDPKAPLPHETGLPLDKAKTDELARLDRSRKWLAKYRTDPERVTREMGETGTMTSGE